MKAEQGREATDRVSSRASRLFWLDGRWVLSASKSSRRSTRSAEDRVAISARREQNEVEKRAIHHGGESRKDLGLEHRGAGVT